MISNMRLEPGGQTLARRLTVKKLCHAGEYRTVCLDVSRAAGLQRNSLTKTLVRKCSPASDLHWAHLACPDKTEARRIVVGDDVVRFRSKVVVHGSLGTCELPKGRLQRLVWLEHQVRHVADMCTQHRGHGAKYRSAYGDPL